MPEQPVQPVRRRQRRQDAPRESIEELFGDMISDRPSGLFTAEEIAARDFPDPEADAGPGAGHGAGPGARGRARPGTPSGPPGDPYHDPAEGAPVGVRRSGDFAYAKNGGDLTAVVVSHGLATVLTLGLWRFWQKAAMRRSIWSHTRLGGEPFEYTGNGWELFFGAVVAVIFLGGMGFALSLALSYMGLDLAGETDPAAAAAAWQGLILAGLVMIAPLIEYARFRARRYRMRRTKWRGLRMEMTGSGLGLAARWAFWAPVTLLTLGLANPFLRVARERYMTDRSWWGKEKFSFSASAWRLMPRWALVLALLGGPLALGLAASWRTLEAEGLLPPIGAQAAAAAEARAAAGPADAAGGGDGAAAGGAASPAPEPEPEPAPAPQVMIIAPPPLMGGELEPGELPAPPPGLRLPPPVNSPYAAAARGPSAGPAAGAGAAAGAAPATPGLPLPGVPGVQAPSGPVAASPADAGGAGADAGADADAGAGAAPEPSIETGVAAQAFDAASDTLFAAWSAASPELQATLRVAADIRDRLADIAFGFAAASPGAQSAAVFGWLGALFLAWASYRAAEIRLFVEGRRIAEAVATCSFTARTYLAAWLAVLWRMIWPGLPIAILIGVIAVLPVLTIDREAMVQGWDASNMFELLTSMGDDMTAQALLLLSRVMNIGMTALLMMWLTSAVMFRAFHSRLCKSVHVEGLASLDRARQRAAAGPREAEGLADAMDIDVGF
ncbi:DUF898 family protein [Rhodovulum sp. DZ06]|uniref:DUF898 family protein n=1 Tax=Rhodovulum sp. DZ06 TaxID=3425126 RepID=UPI003D3287ED